MELHREVRSVTTDIHYKVPKSLCLPPLSIQVWKRGKFCQANTVSICSRLNFGILFIVPTTIFICLCIQLLLLQILFFGSKSLVCGVCIADCQTVEGLCLLIIEQEKATCVGYKLYFKTLVLCFFKQFYKRRQWRDPREKLRDSDPVFSHLQTVTQVRFYIRLEGASHMRFLDRKDTNDVMKFLRWLEAKCNIVPSAIHLDSALGFSLLILSGSSDCAAITYFPSALLSLS